MDYFAEPEHFASLIAALAQGNLATTIENAWYLRQSHSKVAAAMCDELETLWLRENITINASKLQARISLIRAELALLDTDFDRAQTLAEDALGKARTTHDAAASTDAALLLFRLKEHAGDVASGEHYLDQAYAAAKLISDDSRVALVLSCLLTLHSFRKTWRKQEEITSEIESLATVSPQAFAHLRVAQGSAALMSADLLSATRLYLLAIELARATGCLAVEVSARTNLGIGLVNLGDYDGAIDALREAVAVCIDTGWPRQIALALLQAGKTCSEIGRFDEAEALYDQAQPSLEKMLLRHPESATSMMMKRYRAELAFDRGNFSSALAMFEDFAHSDNPNLGPNDRSIALMGLAKCLILLERPADALQAANEALKLTMERGHVAIQIEAYFVAAKASASRSSRTGDFQVNIATPQSDLAYLQLALGAADATPGYKLTEAQYQEVASAYQRNGEYQTAYQYSLKALEAHKAAMTNHVVNKTAMLRVQLETSQARADAEKSRIVAAAATERAILLEQTRSTLTMVNEVGRNITASLEMEHIANALVKNLRRFVDSPGFVLFLRDEGAYQLLPFLALVDDEPVRADVIALSDLLSVAVRSISEHEPIFLQRPSGDFSQNFFLSAVRFEQVGVIPLSVGARNRGLICVLSQRSAAYSENEQLICRTLADYTAIALDNAIAYSKAKFTQIALKNKEQELDRNQEAKSAALNERDEALAFLAHDLRSPLTAILAITDEDSTNAVLNRVRQFSKSALSLTDRFLALARLDRLRVDALEPIDLSSLVDDASETFRSIAAQSQRRLTLDLAFGLHVLGHHESLSRAVANLIDNALRLAPAGETVSTQLKRNLDTQQIELKVSAQSPAMPDWANRILTAPEAGRRPPASARMGLTIVRRVADLHAARILVNRVNGTTEITLRFSENQVE
jgi:signal transduction histidine kinase